MPSVIEELNGEVALDPRHIRERIADWTARLLALYDEVASWVPQSSSDRSGSVDMNEEVMREHRVAPVRLPTLRLIDPEGVAARLIPRGLWIIGANGRVDLFARTSQHLIIDRSDYFSAPQWEIAPALNRLASRPLSREAFLQAIG